MEQEARKRDKAEEDLLKAFQGLQERLNKVKALYARDGGEGSNPPTEDQELIDDRQTAVAMAELLTMGLVEFNPDNDDEVGLTDKGIDYAWDVFHSHQPRDMVALMLFWERIRPEIEDDDV